MPNKFRRQYLLTIEGSPHPQPVGCGDINHERNHLNANAAKLHLADEVERFYQTTLAHRTVTIAPLPFHPATGYDPARLRSAKRLQGGDRRHSGRAS